MEKVLADLAEEAERPTPHCRPGIRMAVAGYLHSFYTGCEAVLSRLARAFGPLPSGENWHRALLLEAAAPREVRPPVLSAETATVLLEFLRFRHFFRVAYGVELDIEKLRPRVDSAPEAFSRFRSDVSAFLDLLDADGVDHQP